MRKKIVAGNWKMNTTIREGEKLVNELIEKLDNYNGNTEVIIAPPYTHLFLINKLIKDSAIKLSAQNCATEESGAYTGEVAVNMLKDIGLNYVIIGHSERRTIYKESDAELNKKITQVLQNNLTPIFCIGEQLTERENKIHEQTIYNQLNTTVFQLPKNDFSKIILAYEPVWAIGTGKVATPEQAQEMHRFIRNKIEHKFGSNIAENTSILYGGSCKPDNATELFNQKDVDGGLIGGASLKANDFYAIINA